MQPPTRRLTASLLVVATMILAFLTWPGTAGAQTVENVIRESAGDSAVHVPLQAQWWVYLVSVFIPVLVALLTKVHASSLVKSSIAIIVAAITTFIQQIIDSDGIFTLEALRTAVLALVIQLLAYHQVWKPVFERTGAPLPDVGIGPAVPPPHPEP